MNPVTSRVDVLSNQWLEFCSLDRARLFCWQLASDEVRMVEAFLALEEDERSALHSDLFVELETPFESGTEHGLALQRELVGQYRREQEPLKAEGLDASWEPPGEAPNASDLDLLVRTCVSFHEHHALPRYLVLVLRPARIRDGAKYQGWLLKLAREAPAGLRAMFFDLGQPPAYTLVSESREDRVVVRAARLDMPGALAEISQGAGGLETPGGRFRDLFLQIGRAIGEQNFARAVELGAAACDVAISQRWYHMTLPVHAALGSSLAGEKRTDEARTHFQAAERNALVGQTDGVPEARELCRKLRLQARLGHGSALITGEQFGEAADVFEATVPLAAAEGDDGTRLECYRLAAFCHERAHKPEVAFRWALDGLEAAKTMPAEALEHSGLPYLGDALLRLCEPAKQESRRDELERELEKMIGRPDWRPEGAAPEAAPGDA